MEESKVGARNKKYSRLRKKHDKSLGRHNHIFENPQTMRRYISRGPGILESRMVAEEVGCRGILALEPVWDSNKDIFHETEST